MGRRSPSSTWTTRYGFVLECSVLGVPMPPLPALTDGGRRVKKVFLCCMEG